MQTFKTRIAEALAASVDIPAEKIAGMLESPPDPAMGDLAFPCFTLAKTMRMAPPKIAAELASKVTLDFVEKAKPTGPYLNFYLNPAALAAEVLPRILDQGRAYGSVPGRGERVVIDYSSPNIAKPFAIGHLRSTMIGHALVEHLQHQGYDVIGVNHLGDWGTQFGMVMAAYEEWGQERSLDQLDVMFLLGLYVRFNEEAKKDKERAALAREWFRKLEAGDARAVELWTRFREVSQEEARRIYKRLGVEFQHYTGESFYNDRLEDTTRRLREAGLLVESQGAQVVDLEEDGMPPCLIQKSDGATLYATRDLAAALYRLEAFQPSRIIYVVGAPQKLHFRQFFRVLDKLEPGLGEKFVHVDFGHYRLTEGSMSTRKGNIIFMEEVLDRGVEMARKVMEEAARGGELETEEIEAVAEQVALGAIIFGDLSNDRVRDQLFDWGKALDFKGDTGPYVQYTRARIASIFRKADCEPPHKADWNQLNSSEEKALLLQLLRFPEVLATATEQLKPSITANHLLDLSRAYSRFYNQHPVLKSEPSTREARLALCAAVSTVLGIGLKLLGIPSPERM